MLFVAATGLQRGDEVHFLSEDDYPSLLALIWRYGAPVVALGLTLLAALLWRGAVRFGPLAPPTIAARRSLAEQIRGTGRFALRHGGGHSLHAASARALDEAARRAITGYAQAAARRARRGARQVTGFDRDALAAAIHDPGVARRRRTAPHAGAARSGAAPNPHQAHKARAWNTAETDAPRPPPPSLFARLRTTIEQAMVGQSEVIEQVLIALVASGHVLIEGVPGPRQDAARARAGAGAVAARTRACSSRPT